MIEVTVYKTMRHEYAGFDMSGHAGYDDIGKDIVCAAVSVLVINTLNSIERFTDDKTSCVSDENSGTVEFRFKDHPSHDAALLLDSMILGLEDIEDSEEYGQVHRTQHCADLRDLPGEERQYQRKRQKKCAEHKVFNGKFAVCTVH